VVEIARQRSCAAAAKTTHRPRTTPAERHRDRLQERPSVATRRSLHVRTAWLALVVRLDDGTLIDVLPAATPGGLASLYTACCTGCAALPPLLPRGTTYSRRVTARLRPTPPPSPREDQMTTPATNPESLVDSVARKALSRRLRQSTPTRSGRCAPVGSRSHAGSFGLDGDHRT
jgi:hypothetical protein